MQLGGIGNTHNTDIHQVTTCMHDHDHSLKGAAGIQMSVESTLQKAEQQEDQMTLSQWTERLLNRGKRLWRGVWGSNDAGNAEESGDKSGKAQVLAQISDSADASVKRTEARVDAGHVNPYFSVASENGARHMTPLQKVKAKVRGVTGHLAGHLPGKFFNFQTKNSFHTKQERPKEDLRKHSRYRSDELEIDCILTDESYLLDSYDRKGEYSQLTTKK